ncbi:FGFR1 oncoprotein partner [Lobulomyces angularis]|nr:FGFR1 oncoprotein partner [Lobulomyces angularis]
MSEQQKLLQDIVLNNLKESGVLGKLKAELRANVVNIINQKENNNTSNLKADKLFQSTEGVMALALIKDFLNFFELSYTLSVLEPQIEGINLPDNNSVNNFLNFDKKEGSEHNANEPLLIKLLKRKSSLAAKYELSELNDDVSSISKIKMSKHNSEYCTSDGTISPSYSLNELDYKEDAEK